ncbi:MAG: cytidine deaminase [Kiloniellales bacterium]
MSQISKCTAVSSSSISQLQAEDRGLLERAQQVRLRAYAPYSSFQVGAALRTRGGRVFDGVNMENASYGVSICAEVGALQASLTAGDFDIEAIAIVGGLIGKDDGPAITPCGRCRQLILEAAQVAGVNARILCANADLSEILVTDIATLLPNGFRLPDLQGRDGE